MPGSATLPRTTNEREPGAEEDPLRRTGYDFRRLEDFAFFALLAVRFFDCFGAGSRA